MNKNTQRLLNIAMSGYDRQREVQYRNNISSLSVPRDNTTQRYTVMLFLHNKWDGGLYVIEFFDKICRKNVKVYLKKGH